MKQINIELYCIFTDKIINWHKYCQISSLKSYSYFSFLSSKLCRSLQVTPAYQNFPSVQFLHCCERGNRLPFQRTEHTMRSNISTLPPKTTDKKNNFSHHRHKLNEQQEYSIREKATKVPAINYFLFLIFFLGAISNDVVGIPKASTKKRS